MSESIMVALITGGLGFLATLLSNFMSHSKTVYRIEQLEKKQDIHNGVIERVYKLEESVSHLESREVDLSNKVTTILLGTRRD